MQFKEMKDLPNGKKQCLFDIGILGASDIVSSITGAGYEITKASVTYRTKSGEDKAKEIPVDSISQLKAKYGFDRWGFAVKSPDGDKLIVQVLEENSAMRIKANDINSVKAMLKDAQPLLKQAAATKRQSMEAYGAPQQTAVMEPAANQAQEVHDPYAQQQGYAPYPQAQPAYEQQPQQGYVQDDAGYRNEQAPQEQYAEPTAPAQAPPARSKKGKSAIVWVILAIVEALFIIPLPFSILTWYDFIKARQVEDTDPREAAMRYNSMRNSVLIGVLFVLISIGIFVWKLFPALVR